MCLNLGTVIWFKACSKEVKCEPREALMSQGEMRGGNFLTRFSPHVQAKLLAFAQAFHFKADEDMYGWAITASISTSRTVEGWHWK